MGYTIYKEQNITLAYQLAIDRTDLANSRTLLVYVKTALLILLSGFTLLKLEGANYFTVFLFFGSILISGLILWYGYVKYAYYKNELITLSKVNHRGDIHEQMLKKIM